MLSDLWAVSGDRFPLSSSPRKGSPWEPCGLTAGCAALWGRLDIAVSGQESSPQPFPRDSSKNFHLKRTFPSCAGDRGSCEAALGFPGRNKRQRTSHLRSTLIPAQPAPPRASGACPTDRFPLSGSSRLLRHLPEALMAQAKVQLQ